MYNHQNIFRRILKEELPCRLVYQDAFAWAFYDLNPVADFHVLVIPTGPYCHFSHFMAHASSSEQQGFFKAVHHVIRQAPECAEGCRLVTHQLKGGGQEIPHFHVHILAGPHLKTI